MGLSALVSGPVTLDQIAAPEYVLKMENSNNTWLTNKTTIVVPIDSRGTNARALLVAGRLAKRLGMAVRVYRQIPEGDAPEPHTEKLEAFASYLRGADRSFEVVEGTDPVQGILGSLGPKDILCMATSGSLLPHGGHLGSMSEAVTRSLNEPLFLVGPEIVPDPPPGPTQRVIVPVDGSAVAEAALGPAANAADRLGVPLWIVTVVSPKAENAAQGAVEAGAEANLVRKYAREMRQAYGVDAQFDVLHGPDAADAITQFAGDDGTVVMTTHGRSGLSRLVAGSVTTSVIGQSKRAVVVYRPDME